MCPFCGGHLLAPAVGGVAPGIAMCRRCEQVWVPAGADARLAPVAGAGGEETEGPGAAPVRPAHPDQCPECGAPWAPDAGGRCRYCREQLGAGDQPVVIIERPGAPERAFGIAGAALRIAAALGATERSDGS